MIAFSQLMVYHNRIGYHKWLNFYIFVPIIVISLLMGFRYQVGTDWDDYLYYYTYILNSGMSWQEIKDSTMEPLYLLMNCFFASFDLPYQGFFFFIMLLHLSLLYKTFEQYAFLLPLGMFFYFTTIFLSSLNIQRQTLSTCVFFYSLQYILNGKFVKYICCITVASLIHYSAIILYPVYFLRYDFFSFLDRRMFQFLIYVISFFIFAFMLEFILSFVSQYVSNAKYLSNMKMLGNEEMTVSSGLGIWATHMIDLLLIFFSDRLSKAYSRYNFRIVFRIFLIGVCLSNVFGNDLFLSRIPFAMESLRFLILAFWVFYVFQIRKVVWMRVLGVGVLLIYFAMFVISIYNGASGSSPFQFA